MRRLILSKYPQHLTHLVFLLCLIEASISALPVPADPRVKLDRWIFKMGDSSTEISVEDARNNLRHMPVNFDADLSPLPEATKTALKDLFAITDDIAILKALSVVNLASGGKQGISVADQRLHVKKLINRLDAVTHPPELGPVFQMLKRVLSEQEGMRNSYRFRRPAYRPEETLPVLMEREYATARISENLREASKFLTEIFPSEHPKNKQAFFDQLMSLDPTHLPGE